MVIATLGLPSPTTSSPKYTWDKTRIDFFDDSIIPPTNDLYFYGIPYHYSNGTTSEWLGFSRTINSIDELVDK